MIKNDEYNVARYIPKKYHDSIDEIKMELDFDNKKGRTVYRYYVYFKDGRYISEIGINNLKKAFKGLSL